MLLLKLAMGIDHCNRLIGTTLAWLALVMTLLGVFNALTRKLGHYFSVNLSSNAYLESQWYLFGIILLLGGSYALREGVHVRVDVIYSKLSERKQAWIDTLGNGFFLIPFCLLVIYVSLPWAWQSISLFEGSPDPDGLPRYIIKAMIPLGFSLLLLQSISEFIFDAAFLSGRINFQQKQDHTLTTVSPPHQEARL